MAEGDGDEDVARGEQIQADGPLRTALIDGVTFVGRPVQYVEVDGRAMFEGDIHLGSIEEVEARTEEIKRSQGGAAGVGITGDRYRWRDCTVAWQIRGDVPNQTRITEAIAHWEANTHLTFVERTSANASQHVDYIEFIDAGGCWSKVGRQGGRQEISIGSGCSRGNAIHEIGHAVGLWHEQSREDRDSFVTIQWANIISGREHNFNQHISDGDDLGSYDYGSIMHYPRSAFSNGGGDTIVPTTAGVSIGQRTALSAGDIAAVNAMYPACAPKPPITDVKAPTADKNPTFDRFKAIFRDGGGKLPVFDKIKHVDDVKSAFLDKRSAWDGSRWPRFGGIRRFAGDASPFVLATGHHAPAHEPTTDVAALAAQLEAVAAELAAASQAQRELVELYAELLAAYEQLLAGGQ